MYYFILFLSLILLIVFYKFFVSVYRSMAEDHPDPLPKTVLFIMTVFVVVLGIWFFHFIYTDMPVRFTKSDLPEDDLIVVETDSVRHVISQDFHTKVKMEGKIDLYEIQSINFFGTVIGDPQKKVRLLDN